MEKKRKPHRATGKPVGRPRTTESQKAITKAERAVRLVERMAAKDKSLAHNISKDLSIIQQDTMLQLALRKQGVDEDYIAEKLKDAMDARVIKMSANGQATSKEYTDMNIRLKAIEMWINIFGYKDKAKPPKIEDKGDKHLHLHNIDKEELNAALAAASIREDTETSED